MSAESVRPSRLAAAPMALFATVMGLGGLSLAWRRAHEVFGASALIGEALMALAGLAFVVVALVQIARAIRHPHAHLAEFRHPVAGNFVPAFTVATALMAAGLAPYAPALARGVWVFASSLHLVFAFLILRRWFTQTRDEAEASPAWFIPVVGNLLMPVVGVPLGFEAASWLFFSVGAMFWLILAPVMTHRLFFVGTLPERALPSLFILLAPPAVGGLAAIALNDGGVSVVSHVLFGFGLFIAALTASLLGRIAKTHFAIGWWALTFPCAAFASLGLAYAQKLPSLATTLIAGAALTFASLIVGLVFVLTLRALARGEFLPTGQRE